MHWGLLVHRVHSPDVCCREREQANTGYALEARSQYLLQSEWECMKIAFFGAMNLVLHIVRQIFPRGGGCLVFETKTMGH